MLQYKNNMTKEEVAQYLQSRLEDARESGRLENAVPTELRKSYHEALPKIIEGLAKIPNDSPIVNHYPEYCEDDYQNSIVHIDTKNISELTDLEKKFLTIKNINKVIE